MRLSLRQFARLVVLHAQNKLAAVLADSTDPLSEFPPRIREQCVGEIVNIVGAQQETPDGAEEELKPSMLAREAAGDPGDAQLPEE